MSLVTYRKKRDFGKSAEPRGARAVSRKSGRLFVVQKHDASHMHYDFRLEHNGVLKSWAVPKGPSLNPAIKRLAVEVEDHPLEYGKFEGTIPEGEYGGGTVLLWDRGTWEPQGNVAAGLRQGKLKFVLHGQKLRGSWMLVRSRRKSSGKPQWLLFKRKDEAAEARGAPDIVERLPRSVKTGRDLSEIAAGKKAHKRMPAPRKPARQRATAGKSHGLPRHIEPQLPTLVESAPEGNEWFHEVKFDGYRMICTADGKHVRFETRNQLDWTAKLPGLTAAVAELDLASTILDGEILAINDQGVSDFQQLQAALKDREKTALIYAVFDLLFDKGKDLRSLPLEERKARLQKLGLSSDSGMIRYCGHVVGDGPQVFTRAEQAGMEGIVSKRRDRPYTSGRGMDWVKVKAQQTAEFVIDGYTAPSGSRHGLGALLLAYYDNDFLRYAGKVGTGFDTRTLVELKTALQKIEQPRSPLDPLPRGIAGKIHWVKPRLVANISFSNWTKDLRLRHPVFEGLRLDKSASEVRRDVPAHTLGNRRTRLPKPAAAGRRHATSETEIEGVRMTHPDKLLWPDDRVSKRDLASYYLEVAQQMLPYVANRPLSLVRCPDGIDGERFFQKHPGVLSSPELERVKIREKTKEEQYFYIQDARSLVALSQFAVVEIHVWGARVDAPEKPDQIVLDLDPAPDVAWKAVVQAAVQIRDFLEELGLTSFVKTSGGKGLHLVMPLRRMHAWDAVRDFSELLATSLARMAPEQFTANMSKKKRTGRIFIDYLRNQRGATSVAPFSTRARPGVPISFPLDWQQLSRVTAADKFTIHNSSKVLLREFWPSYSSVDQRITRWMIKMLQAVQKM